MKKATLFFSFMLFSIVLVFAQQPSKEVRDFVTKMYIHGIPYDEAKSLGTKAVPELIEMLKSPVYEHYYSNIVLTLGFIGDPAAIKSLIGFVESSRGEISLDRFNAVLVVYQALGHISQKSNGIALQTLKEYTALNTWQTKNLQFSFKKYKYNLLSEVLARQAIVGLGISGKLEAQQKLDELRRNTSTPKDWSDNLSEAMNLNDRVQRQGAEKVFGKKM